MATDPKTTPDEPSNASTPAHKGLSVDDYTPTSMSLEAFKALSRNQQKKVMRQELWDNGAQERRDKRRAKQKENRKRKNDEGVKKEMAVAHSKRPTGPQEKSGVRVVIDMDFESKMLDKEIKSVCSQVARCYSLNRASKKALDLSVTQLRGRIKERFDTVLEQHKNWDAEYVRFMDSEYIDGFSKDDLVYLTADSENVIESLDARKVYVVGGIVDKNRYPRLTLEKAQEQGIAHGQLPIGKYIQMSTRKVLTVNHIFEIMARFVELGDWKKAFLDVIPQRKFAEKDADNGGDSD